QEALQEHAQHTNLPLNEQAHWALDRLQRIHRLVSVVHTRAGSSPAVAAWHDTFHELADSLLADSLRNAGVADADLAAASRIGTFVIEGLLSHPQDEDSQADIIRLLGALAVPR
ncbi:MAG: hypothetical protein JO079_02805, partial [Frankiaceae bacterium]|nr:hypothetical protein [Frankiaceae bacterium]